MSQTITISFSMTTHSTKNIEARLLRKFREEVLTKIPVSGRSFNSPSIKIINADKTTPPVKTEVSRELAVDNVKDIFRVKSIKFLKQHKRPGLVKFFGLVLPNPELSKKDVTDVFNNLLDVLHAKGISAALTRNELGVRSLVVRY